MSALTEAPRPAESPTPGAFATRDFRLFLGMRVPAVLATRIQDVAVGWQVYDITHRPLDLGFVGLAQFAPVFGLALVSGHVSDRFDRRLVLVTCLTVQVVCAALLLALAMSGLDEVWPIYLVLVLFGAARSFSGPASAALLPNLVPLEQLGKAFAVNSSTFQAATIVGPAVGGLVFVWGAPAAFAVSGLLAMLAAIAVAAIRTRPARAEPRAITWESLVAGIRFIHARPAILGAISLDLFAVLLGGATALLPIYARDILVVGPFGLGLLRSAPAVGATIVGLVLARRPLGGRAGRTMFVSVAVYGIATIVFGLSRSFALSLGALAILGAADMVSVFVRQNLVQRATPDEMRGRVSAVNFVFVGASNELGEMESGLTAAWLGTIESVVLGGLGSLLVVALWIWRFPALARVDRLEDIRPQ
ncbi:MAG TPA: MFS transporter [Alphaproteobacteria bacterium]|nr:MFS transporter [Alphaproteobacteria bacterium]